MAARITRRNARRIDEQTVEDQVFVNGEPTNRFIRTKLIRTEMQKMTKGGRALRPMKVNIFNMRWSVHNHNGTELHEEFIHDVDPSNYTKVQNDWIRKAFSL